MNTSRHLPHYNMPDINTLYSSSIKAYKYAGFVATYRLVAQHTYSLTELLFCGCCCSNLIVYIVARFIGVPAAGSTVYTLTYGGRPPHAKRSRIIAFVVITFFYVFFFFYNYMGTYRYFGIQL